MEKMKCKSCGADLKIDENYATCRYCGAVYKLNEDINVNIKIDEATKEIINNRIDKIKKYKNIIFLPFIIFLIITISFAFIVPKIFKNINTEQYETFEIDKFNAEYEMLSGTKDKMFAVKILELSIINNKKNKNKITVSYNDIVTEETEKITDIKNGLEKKKYEIILDYDEKGYVNKITIK